MLAEESTKGLISDSLSPRFQNKTSSMTSPRTSSTSIPPQTRMTRTPTQIMSTPTLASLRASRYPSAYPPPWPSDCDQVIIAPSVVEADASGTDEQITDCTEITEEMENDACIICRRAVASVMMVPCGHAHYCMTCAGMIYAGAVDEEPRCPVCRLAVTGLSEVGAA